MCKLEALTPQICASTLILQGLQKEGKVGGALVILDGGSVVNDVCKSAVTDTCWLEEPTLEFHFCVKKEFAMQCGGCYLQFFSVFLPGLF